MSKIKSCKCGKFNVNIEMYPEPREGDLTECPECKTSPYTKEEETPMPAPQGIKKLDKVPEGMLRCFTIGMGDVLIGMAKELPDHIIMHIVPADVALALPLDAAYNLHDGLCTAINILDEGSKVHDEDLPTDPKKWN